MTAQVDLFDFRASNSVTAAVHIRQGSSLILLDVYTRQLSCTRAHLQCLQLAQQVRERLRLDEARASMSVGRVLLSWNSTAAVSSYHPRDILADTHDTRDILARMSRGFYEDATRKLLPWNLSFVQNVNFRRQLNHLTAHRFGSAAQPSRPSFQHCRI